MHRHSWMLSAALVACGAPATHTEAPQVSVLAEPALVEAVETVDAGGLDAFAMANAIEETPTPPQAGAIGGMGGGGIGDGCIGLSSTCASRAGFGHRPDWCRGRDGRDASLEGHVELVELRAARDAHLSEALLAPLLGLLEECQREAIAARPSDAVGDIVVALTFTHGCVRRARLVSSTVRDRHFAECAAGVLLGASAAERAATGNVRVRLRSSID